MPADILARIVADRRARLANEGAAQGVRLPSARPADMPVLPFPQPVICEIKRRSPSRGALSSNLDPVAQAGRYVEASVRAVSVLTEQDYFDGSLADLIAVKRAHPDLAVLRKDFLVIPEDVEVAWQAGADAVLIIAAILTRAEIGALLETSYRRGLTPLVEVHDRADVDRVRPFRPAVVGINARDLATFRVDLLGPPALASHIDWPCRLVFESGIFHREDAALARESGFDAVLVGEAVVRQPSLAADLVATMGDDDRATAAGDLSSPASRPVGFWGTLARTREIIRLGSPLRPIVKICGITNEADARLAVALGADMLGLIYAESPRTAPAGLARRLRFEVDVPLVGVVVEPAEGSNELLERAQADLAAGDLDALQLHGAAAPETAATLAPTYYKAIRPESAAVARAEAVRWRSARVLVDAWERDRAGGTGTPVTGEVLDAWRDAVAAAPHGALWIAGGLGPDNVAALIHAVEPELIDASSRLEASPGRKDPTRLRIFFEEIDRASRSAVRSTRVAGQDEGGEQ